MNNPSAKTAEQSMQEFIAQNRISHSATADRHIATVLAGAPILYSFIDQLRDGQTSAQLTSAVTQLDSAYLQSVAPQLGTEPSADALVDHALKNIEKDKEHALQSIIMETPSVRFLARIAEVAEPPVVAREHIPSNELLGAMDFLHYAAAFSEAT